MSRIKNANWDQIEDGTLEDAINGIGAAFEEFTRNAELFIKEAKRKKNK